MKKILLTTAMVLAATTANATLYETPMGYIDSETNMIHFTSGVSAGVSGPVTIETPISVEYIIQ